VRKRDKAVSRLRGQRLWDIACGGVSREGNACEGMVGGNTAWNGTRLAEGHWTQSLSPRHRHGRTACGRTPPGQSSHVAG